MFLTEFFQAIIDELRRVYEDYLTFEGPTDRLRKKLRVMYGRGEINREEFEAIVRQGGRRAEIYRQLRALRDANADRIRHGIPNIPRRVSGFNLTALLPEHGFNLAQRRPESGDELFAGYRKHVAHFWAEEYRRIPAWARGGIESAGHHAASGDAPLKKQS